MCGLLKINLQPELCARRAEPTGTSGQLGAQLERSAALPLKGLLFPPPERLGVRHGKMRRSGENPP